MWSRLAPDGSVRMALVGLTRWHALGGQRVGLYYMPRADCTGCIFFAGCVAARRGRTILFNRDVALSAADVGRLGVSRPAASSLPVARPVVASEARATPTLRISGFPKIQPDFIENGLRWLAARPGG